MAINNTLADVNQETFDNFEAIVIDLLRSDHTELDVRKGTALRDLLVRPSSETSALNGLNNEQLRLQLSLELMATAAVQDPDVLSALLSNFDLTLREGVEARGSVIIYTTENKQYFIPEQFVFTIGDLEYTSGKAWVVVTTEVTDPTAQILMQQADDGRYFFIVPVAAVEPGVQYNAGVGEAVEINQELGTGITDSYVYGDITGGEDAETVEELVARLPQSIAFKMPVSDASIAATLMTQFDAIRDISTIGMGDEEMLRDKHNLFNVSVGSRIDTYPRTALVPETATLLKTATKVADGVYTFTIDKDDLPGFYLIRSINSPESVITYDGRLDLPIIGSYPFDEIRGSEGTEDTFHDFDPNNMVVETAYSRWQTSTVTIYNIPAPDSGVWPDELTLKTEIYYPKHLKDIQEYLDDPSLRNNEADYVVRGAIPCMVTISATLFTNPNVILDLDAVTASIVSYINHKRFGDQLTASQLSGVFHEFDIIRVGLDDTGVTGLTMEGRIRAADGSQIVLTGNTLDIADYAVPELLVSEKTSVFMTDPRNIFLNVRSI